MLIERVALRGRKLQGSFGCSVVDKSFEGIAQSESFSLEEIEQICLSRLAKAPKKGMR